MPDQKVDVMDGGGMLGVRQANEQERRLCAEIAAGVDRGLMFLSVGHPRRAEYQEMLDRFRRAAGLRYAR